MRVGFEIDDREVQWPTGLDFAGQHAATSFYVYHIISRVLHRFQPSAIVELGTYEGAMTMYLGLCGQMWGIPVHTFDIEPLASRRAHHVLEAQGVTMHWVDEFSKQGMKEIMDALSEPGYLICDGGDKQREFATFAPILPTGTVISVHDWTTEVKELNADVGIQHFESDEWMAYGANMLTVVKIGNSEDMTKQTTDEDIKAIRDKWIEVIGEETRA